MEKYLSAVTFRLLLMPCCAQQLCWVNPRLPNHCPECGTYVWDKIKKCIHVSSDNATLEYSV